MASALPAQQTLVDESVVFAETDGMVAVEAEHYFAQTSDNVRAFHLTHSTQTPTIKPDGDPNHAATASGGAYLEILPDTRRTHADKLITNTNFSPKPGKLAVLNYKVNFSTPGRYYVWARAFSTGSEDNGLHVGIDGTWPESGQRMQWCNGKNSWRWESKQRTKDEHCGEPHKLFLDVPQAGEHVIQFSMREDGFEFDKWIMTTNRDFVRPEDAGPQPKTSTGKVLKPFPVVQKKESPPSKKKTNAKQKGAERRGVAQLTMSANDFADGKNGDFYVDQKKWLAVNPNDHKTAFAALTFPFPTGAYHITLKTVGENDGSSSYAVSIDGEKIGSYSPPLSKEMFDEGPAYNKTWKNVQITEGAMVGVTFTIGSADGKEYSRARWRAVEFSPADETTRKLAKPFLKQQQSRPPKNARQPSPTKPVSDAPLQLPRLPDGDGSVVVDGELKLWHTVTLNLNGPYADEKDNQPNPFTDLRLTATFKHSDGSQYVVPGYFAADGNAANSSAGAGTVWRAHFSPDKTGTWTYQLSFQQGKLAALDHDAAAKPFAPFDGKSGSFEITPSDKLGRDLRSEGLLKYVGKRYLQFAGSKRYFLKAGADAPETLLAFTDFDNTIAGNQKKAPLKTWAPHVQDWNDGDPTWGQGRGKGLIGAVNYLSGKGCNAFSFLTYNAGGDGDNVWPFIHRDDKLHYDCSKLDQWSIVFNHATTRGMYLHFKMQETENDDNNQGAKSKSKFVPTSLDGGNLGVQRKLYCRELVARFGHNLALNWNLGEENTQSTVQIKAMIDYIADLDAYNHNIVIHTYPGQQDKVYRPLLGDQSKLTGASLQNSSLETTHAQTLKWVAESEKAGKPWIVAFDESGSAGHAQCPDLGYRGFDGHDRTGKMAYTQHKVRKQTLWGTLMAGGTGCEYYFGYQFVENDILCEDWRSRDQSWDYCRIAIGFFHDHQIPFWEMQNADELVGNPKHKAAKFCFAKPQQIYLVYLPDGGESQLDLGDANGEYSIRWFNPRTGGELLTGTLETVTGGKRVSLGEPPADPTEDWLVVIKKTNRKPPQTSQWEKIEATGEPTARHEAALVSFKEKVYLLGGRRINPVDVFDPDTHTWTQNSPTPMELHHFQAVAVDDAIYLIGAMNGQFPKEKPIDSVVAYFPASDEFKMNHRIPLDRRRGGAGAVLHKGKIYIVGGITNGHMNGFVPWFDEYDPKTGAWKALADAPHARDHFQAVIVENKLYAVGGRTTSKSTGHVFDLTVAPVDVYDFETQQWLPAEQCPLLPTPRAGNMAAVWNNEVIVGGGESQQKVAHNEVEVYNVTTNKWRNGPRLQRGRHGSGLAIVGNYMYTASGSGNRGGRPELTSIERLRLPMKD
jgi:hypothetical protein